MGLARAQGLRAGFLRPVSLAPFPSARLAALSDTVRSLVLLEASPSPWSDAVRTAAGGRVPVTVVRGGAGTGLPSAEETARALLQRA
jgi:pyruvate/2-oxoacid:ferredoxin oxidoreductase alpha subunit